ncbi:MAG TPA: aminotransferase class V-fold PLP-dependent enzyme [Candidatus Polarisedimenticolaceae bacterium]
MTEAEIRAEFPGAASVAYFNAASATLVPTCVAQAVERTLRAQVERGVHTWADDMRRVEGTRSAIARLIGAAPAEIAFAANTGEAISKVADGFAWRDGDEVVLGDLEYPANVYPWAVQRDRGVGLRVVRSEGGRLTASRLIDAIGPRTRVLTVSQVQFSTGYRVDLARLGEACRRHDVLLVVDAIQGLPVYPVDVKALGIGALAAEGRKWLMGPSGTGFLYLAPEWLDRIRPRAAGALSVTGAGDMLRWVRELDASGQLDLGPLWRPGSGRFEPGYPNVPGIAGLGAALELAARIGLETIRARVERHVERLVAGLAERGLPVHGPVSPDERSGIVSFGGVPDPDLWCRELGARGISLGVRDGWLRAAPHVYTADADVDRLFASIDALSRGGLAV